MTAAYVVKGNLFCCASAEGSCTAQSLICTFLISSQSSWDVLANSGVIYSLPASGAGDKILLLHPEVVCLNRAEGVMSLILYNGRNGFLLLLTWVSNIPQKTISMASVEKIGWEKMWEKTLVPFSSSGGSNLLSCNPVVVLRPGVLKDPPKGRGTESGLPPVVRHLRRLLGCPLRARHFSGRRAELFAE